MPLDILEGFGHLGITFLIIYFIAIVTLFDFNRIVEPFLLYFFTKYKYASYSINLFGSFIYGWYFDINGC